MVNLRTEYRFNEHVMIFGRLDNLFNEKYNNFGTYGETGDVLEGIGIADQDTRFFGVSAPRAGWVGIKLSLYSWCIRQRLTALKRSLVQETGNQT